jgi:hypothetical protein
MEWRKPPGGRELRPVDLSRCRPGWCWISTVCGSWPWLDVFCNCQFLQCMLTSLRPAEAKLVEQGVGTGATA